MQIAGDDDVGRDIHRSLARSLARPPARLCALNLRRTMSCVQSLAQRGSVLPSLRGQIKGKAGDGGREGSLHEGVLRNLSYLLLMQLRALSVQKSGETLTIEGERLTPAHWAV